MPLLVTPHPRSISKIHKLRKFTLGWTSAARGLPFVAGTLEQGADVVRPPPPTEGISVTAVLYQLLRSHPGREEHCAARLPLRALEEERVPGLQRLHAQAETSQMAASRSLPVQTWLTLQSKQASAHPGLLCPTSLWCSRQTGRVGLWDLGLGDLFTLGPLEQGHESWLPSACVNTVSGLTGAVTARPRRPGSRWRGDGD